MSVRIEAVDGGELALSGDLNTRIALPSDKRDGRFSIAFSGGTLVSGTHHEYAQSCTFEVQVEGASIRLSVSDGAATARVVDALPSLRAAVAAHDGEGVAAGGAGRRTGWSRPAQR